MKSFLIIGMGRFGSHLCRNLAKLGNEVMIIDQNEELLEPGSCPSILSSSSFWVICASDMPFCC